MKELNILEFGWINLAGGITVVLMLIPNIIYAIKNKDEKNLCTNRFMNITEQAGRYGCIVLMWLPLLVGKFGFSSVTEMILYFILSGALLLLYYAVCSAYYKNRTLKLAIVLAVLPSCIFLANGILLRHWLLVIFAVLFSIGHIFVTQKNNQS